MMPKFKNCKLRRKKERVHRDSPPGTRLKEVSDAINVERGIPHKTSSPDFDEMSAMT